MSAEQKHFIRYAAEILICGFVASVLCMLVILASMNPESYAAGYEQKFARLTSAPAPRLVLVGGSSLAIGVNSKTLERKIGLHPTNMGMFAGVGLQFMFESLDGYLHEGDVVLFVPEHEVLQQPPYGSGHYLLETLHTNPRFATHMISYHSLTTTLHHLPQWFQGRIKSMYVYNIGPYFYKRELPLSDRLYNVYNFNAYGDVIAESAGDYQLTKEELLKGESGYVGTGGMNPETLAMLKVYIEELEGRGVRVFVSFPAMAQSIYDSDPVRVKTRVEELRGALGEERVIGSIEDFIVPDDVFLDASSHLTAKGRDEYTKRLVSLLIPHLNAE